MNVTSHFLGLSSHFIPRTIDRPIHFFGLSHSVQQCGSIHKDSTFIKNVNDNINH